MDDDLEPISKREDIAPDFCAAQQAVELFVAKLAAEHGMEKSHAQLAHALAVGIFNVGDVSS
jgi:hypothetical protein